MNRKKLLPFLIFKNPKRESSYDVFSRNNSVTACSRSYRNVRGKILGPKNFFILFGFFQPSPDLKEIGVFKGQQNLVTIRSINFEYDCMRC